MRGMTESILLDDRLDGRAAHRLQHLGDAEGADERRQQPDAAGEIGEAEGEALVVVVGLLADRGDEQAEEAGDVALQRIAAGERAGDDDAEHRDPEELEALELQRHLAEDRRQRGDAEDAEQRAEPGARGRDAHRPARRAPGGPAG